MTPMIRTAFSRLSKNYHILLFPLMILLCACAPGVNENDSWDELLKRQHQELLETTKAVDRLVSKLPDRLSNLQKHLYLLRSKFEKLMLYFDLKSGNPLVLRDILGVLGWFEGEANRLVLPFKQEKAAIQRQMENLNDLSRKLKEEKNLIETSGPQTHEKVAAYLNDCASLMAKLQPLSRSLAGGTEAVETFLDLLRKDRSEIEHESNRVLKTHMLKRTPGFFSVSAWLGGAAAAKKWASRFGMYLLEPSISRGWDGPCSWGKLHFFPCSSWECS